jgi:predicted phage terminase large subunit-like protein
MIKNGARAVVLPMEFDPDHPHRHPKDPRTKKGELLFQQRFPKKVLDRMKADPATARTYQAQYNQAPQSDTGGLFQREWFNYYEEKQDESGRDCYFPLDSKHGVRKDQCWRFICADTAMSERKTADNTVIQTWDVEGGDVGGRMFLVDQKMGRWDSPTVEKMLRNTHATLGDAHTIIVLESSMAELPILQRLSKDGLPVYRMKYDTPGKGKTYRIPDKVTKATLASLWFERAKVFFPIKKDFVPELEAELLSFPECIHDDQTDVTSVSCHFSSTRDRFKEIHREKYKYTAWDRFMGNDKILEGRDKKPQSPFSLDNN